jgi:phosphonate degradation associated HDIG domain protein
LKTANSINDIVEEVFKLYELHGNDDYIGEPVSQIEHASQSAQLAEKEGYEPEVVLAAFFHDIGHICAKKKPKNDMGGYGMLCHERVGANYLRKKGFPEKIARLMENHVEAKRYLCFKHPEYYEKLSVASKATFEFQGGKMTVDEAVRFENDPLFDLSIKMREWDETAKEESIPLVDLEKLKAICRQILS